MIANAYYTAIIWIAVGLMYSLSLELKGIFSFMFIVFCGVFFGISVALFRVITGVNKIYPRGKIYINLFPGQSFIVHEGKLIGGSGLKTAFTLTEPRELVHVVKRIRFPYLVGFDLDEIECGEICVWFHDLRSIAYRIFRIVLYFHLPIAGMGFLFWFLHILGAF